MANPSANMIRYIETNNHLRDNKAMTTTPPYNLLTILGPTASGKTRLAVTLARHLDGEIISADSRQVFRGMDIGTGKDLHEYGTAPYHLIDILDAGQEFNVFTFQRLFFETFEEIRCRGHLPILCGGTGMYLDAALRGYRLVAVPENTELRAELEKKTLEELADLLRDLRLDLHNNTDLLDRQRIVRAIEIAQYEKEHGPSEEPFPAIRPLVIGIRWERSELRSRITQRLRQRLEGGMVTEVERLHQEGVPWERLDYYGLEYRFVGAHLRGELNFNDLFQKLNSAIHGFAKRQETWFRRMEKHGVKIHWVNGSADPLGEAQGIIDQAVQEKQ